MCKGNGNRDFEKWHCLINQIASGINDSISLNQTTKRFQTHYNKKCFFAKLFEGHLDSVKGKIHHGDYILVDGSDIQKKYDKMMEGLDWVKDGDKGSFGLGYWLMNIVHFNKDGELTPLYNKLYSFDHGATSENLEVIKAIKMITANLTKELKFIFDRGMDREILKDFIIRQCNRFILRLKKNSKLRYQGRELSADQIAGKVKLTKKMTAVKIKKNKKVIRAFKCGAVKVQYNVGRELLDLWLIVSKKDGGGYCYLLANSSLDDVDELIEETFMTNGYRWKIEEYHRHIKSCYKVEDIQIKTFEGLESMLAILTIAMSIVYRELASIHIKLLLESGIKTLNKNKLCELHNFIYYKVSNIMKILLANVNPKAFLPQRDTLENQKQFRIAFGDC